MRFTIYLMTALSPPQPIRKAVFLRAHDQNYPLIRHEEDFAVVSSIIPC